MGERVNVFVSDVVHRSAETWPDRVALQDAPGASRVTYGELWRSVERGASALRSRGVGTGDRVLLAAESGTAWMPAFLSIVHAGCIAVPVPAFTEPGLIRLLVLFAAIKLVVGDRRGTGVHDAAGDTPFVTHEELLAGEAGPARDAAEPAAARDEHATAALLFTSGSTTRPRAVALSHAALRANLRSLQALRRAEENEAMLSVLPPAHAYELVAGQLAPLAAGARVVYAGVPLPNRLIDTIRTARVTRALVVPALLDAMARDVLDRLVRDGDVRPDSVAWAPSRLLAAFGDAAEPSRQRIMAAARAHIGSDFRVAIVGGAAIDPAWPALLDAIGIDVDVGYGLTEAGPVVTMGRAAACPPGSAGRALPDVEIRIGADDEVLVRTKARMQGYAGDAAATAAASEDDWLRTGDRGRLDAEGFLFITGRIKEAMVTSAGETIYPEEIEPWYASPAFAESAVVPVAGEDGNDRPTLVIVPASDAVAADAGALARVVGDLRAAAPPRLRVSGYAVRTEPLPRTAVGKIRRRALGADLAPHEVRS